MLFDWLLSETQHGKLPKFQQNNKAIVNVQNEYDRCFRFALESAIHIVNKDTQQPQKYLDYFEENRLDDIEYPVNPLDLPLIEQRLNILINISSNFVDIKRARHPMYISRHKSVCKIDLL